MMWAWDELSAYRVNERLVDLVIDHLLYMGIIDWSSQNN